MKEYARNELLSQVYYCPVSNRQFFAFLKLPDTASECRADARNRERLIGNDMHSPAKASALQCATSVFLIGNEFQLQRARRKNPHPSQTALRMGHPTERGKAASSLPAVGRPPHSKRKAPRSQRSCEKTLF